MPGYTTYPGLTNHGPVTIRGTDTVAYFGIYDHEPNVWIYSLWNGDDGQELVSHGELNLRGLDLTPDQVARIAFLMDVDYAS